MRSRLEQRLRHGGLRQARVVDGSAERLPFADQTIDTVVSTLVLCTVDAPDMALHEIARVLRSGGHLLYIEHVRSESPTLARWQDLLAAPWRCFARGCYCNKATGELLAVCGLMPGPVSHAIWHGMPPIVRPLIIGQAHKPR
jgi:ubiquinone/menaquinone biosynthesis C-methylase UbiE